MKKIITAAFFFTLFVGIIGIASVSIAQTDGADLQNSINQLRQERKSFKDEKAKEASERQQAAKEKSQAKRKEAEVRRADAEMKMEENRKIVLLRLIEVQIKHLDKTNNRVQKMPNISSELKIQLKAEIESAKTVIGAKRVEVADATGKDAIKKLAKEIKDLFKTKREIVKKIVDAIHASRADKAVEVASERSAAIKKNIQELSDAGENTEQIESDLLDADNNIAGARKEIEKKNFNDANESLKNAYEKFKDIAKKMKGLE